MKELSNDIKVSVQVEVYNHEKYLKKCLDGILNQKTNFKYEILINDDASTDKSAEIIKEYANKYPEVVIPVLHTENKYSKGIKIIWEYLYPITRGKYVAFCEGDDFWTDVNKLQKQYDAMELNQDCSACTHVVQTVKEDGLTLVPRKYPDFNIKSGKYSDIEFVTMLKKYPFQTSSYFMRKTSLDNAFKEKGILQDFILTAPTGDEALMLLSSANGNLFFINEIMSFYRQNSNGSWTTRIRNQEEKLINNNKRFIKALELFKEYSNHRFDEIIDERIRYRSLDYKYFEESITKGKKIIYSKEYRELYNKYSTKRKIGLFLEIYLPFVYKAFQRKRGKA